jgi:hypothetical protein
LHIKRLLAVVMTGFSRGDISSVRIDERGNPRTVDMTVKSNVISGLKVAGKPACSAQGCQIALELREWILYVDAVPADQINNVVVFPFPQFPLTENPVNFFKNRDVNGVSLPVLRKNGLSRQNVQFFTFDETAVQVEAPPYAKSDVFLLPAGGREIALLPATRLNPKWTLTNQSSSPGTGPAVATTPAGSGTPAAPAPARQMMHLVLEPRPVPNWPPGVLALRLKEILEASNGFRAVVRAGGESVTNTLPQLEVAGSRLIVWSGQSHEAAQFTLEGWPAFLGTEPVISPPVPSGVAEGRIQPNHHVARASVTIPPMHLADKWQVSVEPINQIYGRPQPARMDERCEFNLRTKIANSVPQVDRLVRDGASLRSTANVQIAQGAQLELEVKQPGLAPCFAQVVPLSQEISWKRENNTPVAATKVALTPRGRWLLALYAPQGIGTGLPGEASSQSIIDARYQILDWTTQYLDKWRDRFFSQTDPIRTALGFDLALVSGADVQSAEPFAEASVITGQYRQSPTAQFKIDRIGDQRLNAFLGGARGSGSAPSIDSLQQTIIRYSNLFSPLSNEKYPVVFYVAAGLPNPESCRDWKRMTANVPARVLAIAFASSSTTLIAQYLGQNSEAIADNTEQRSLGYYCKGENESVLFFAPFQDLVARAPDLTLEPLFRRMDRFMGLLN